MFLEVVQIFFVRFFFRDDCIEVCELTVSHEGGFVEFAAVYEQEGFGIFLCQTTFDFTFKR